MSIGTDQLKVYEGFIKGNKTTYLSAYTPDTTTAGKASAAKRDNFTIVIKKSTYRMERKDIGRCRKYHDQEDTVVNLVAGRWADGDPIGKLELRAQVWARDDCAEDTPFYRSYIDPTKVSAPSGWTNWLDCLLGRAG